MARKPSNARRKMAPASRSVKWQVAAVVAMFAGEIGAFTKGHIGVDFQCQLQRRVSVAQAAMNNVGEGFASAMPAGAYAALSPTRDNTG